MVLRTISGHSGNRQRLAGVALLESVIAISIVTLLVLALCSFTLFSSRSFAALFHYVDLDDINRLATDYMTRDIRQALRVKSTKTDPGTGEIIGITLQDADGTDLTYNYDPAARTLTRSKGESSTVLVDNCDQLKFSLGQRNTTAGGYHVYEAATPKTCKVINVSWKCSRKMLGRVQNTESVQTARIVIRKQSS